VDVKAVKAEINLFGWRYLKQFGKRNLREIEKWKAPEMDKPIEAIIQDLNQNEKSHSTRLNSLEAANYLNQELLQQIDGLRTDNEQLREENCRLRLEISTVSRLPSIDSGYPLTHGSLHQLPRPRAKHVLQSLKTRATNVKDNNWPYWVGVGKVK